MDSLSLQVLEFGKILEIVSGYALSSFGIEAIRQTRVMTSPAEIQSVQGDIRAMVLLLEAQQRMPSNGWHDIRPTLKRCQAAGSELEAGEIIAVGEFVTAVRRVQFFLQRNRDLAPTLVHYAQQLIPLLSIEEAVQRVFDEQGQIRDSASRDLLRIRKALRLHRERLVKRLERLMRMKYHSYLQEQYYTLREGRYVIPIDAKFQKQINGIVHGRSATGVTVYIEPVEIVQEGNELRDLQRDEQIECRKILRELTAKISECQTELRQNLHILQWLDETQAKARFGFDYRMQAPQIAAGKPLKLLNAKHPLLVMQHGLENVVPCSIEFGADQKGVVITGPNTGGKTVILKTVGILVLMAQCGMLIPADGDSRIPVYQHIGADIGDQQSIEQSLSTFSSHIRNILQILNSANPRTLILIDEMGTGTDPLEGGPLAVSVLESFLENDSTFFVTTHLHDLKIFAFHHDRVENASLEFDIDTLKPTYVFQIGLPGQSNALHIAHQLGMPEAIVRRAAEKMEAKGITPEDLLHQLSEEVRQAKAMREQAANELEAAENLQNESETRLEKAKREAKELVRRYEKKAQGLLQELDRRIKTMEKQQRRFEQEWEEKLKSLVQHAKPGNKPDSVIEKLKDELEALKQRRIGEPETAPALRHTQQSWRWEDLNVRSRVRVHGLSDLGEVRSVNRQRDWVEITINTLTLRISSGQIAAIFPPMENPEKLYQSSFSVERPESSPHEIDVHGMTVDEMIPVVEKYIDEAFRSGRPSVRIIHGHGSGRLRQAVRRLMGEVSFVERFRNGMDFEGGSGVTVVEFRSA